MPSVLVRLNLPGFASPEPFRLGNAPASIAGLACAVLQEIGGFSQDELEAVRNHLDQVPLTLLGELCAGQLVELASDAELGVFLATAESPKGPPIIEVRPRHSAGAVSPLPQSPLAGLGMNLFESPTPSATSLGGMVPLSASPEVQEQRPPASRFSEDKELQEHLQLQQELQQKQRQLQQQQLLQQQFEHAAHAAHTRDRGAPEIGKRINGHGPAAAPAAPAAAAAPAAPAAPAVPAAEAALPASSRWEQETGPGRSLQHSPSAPAFVNGAEKQGTSGSRNQLHTSSFRSAPAKQRATTPDSQRRGSHPGQEASSRASSVSSRHREAPVHIRLYQEKDDRRRRLEQARLRQLEKEEEDLRVAAQKALGRQPSPSRRRDPSPGPGSESSRAAVDHSMASSQPVRGKPPMPVRSHDSHGRSKPARKSVDGPEKFLSLPQGAAIETSSVGSHEGGPLGQPSLTSVGTGVEDSSFCGDADDEVHRLQQQVASQQQRIEFLEKMHQQALRQLRTSREELSEAQRQRLKEADKVLGLEQLVSELQVLNFESGAAAMEGWLRRARQILEGE